MKRKKNPDKSGNKKSKLIPHKRGVEKKLCKCFLKSVCKKETTQKNKIVGGGCDGCELMYVGMPKNINSIDTSAGWKEKGQKILITGTVFKIGGKIPAPNVVIYYWQTDNNGYYSPKEGMDEHAKRHGHIWG